MTGKKWTKQEIDVLSLHVEVREMAKLIDRSEAAIYSKLFELRKEGKIPKKRSDRQIMNEHRIIVLANKIGVKLREEQA